MTAPTPAPIELVMIAETLRTERTDDYRALVTPYVHTIAQAGELTLSLLSLSIGLCGMMRLAPPVLGHAGQVIDEDGPSPHGMPPAPIAAVAELIATIVAGADRTEAPGDVYVRLVTSMGGDERPVFIRQVMQLAAEVLSTVLYVRPVHPETE